MIPDRARKQERPDQAGRSCIDEGSGHLTSTTMYLLNLQKAAGSLISR